MVQHISVGYHSSRLPPIHTMRWDEVMVVDERWDGERWDGRLFFISQSFTTHLLSQSTISLSTISSHLIPKFLEQTHYEKKMRKRWDRDEICEIEMKIIEMREMRWNEKMKIIHNLNSQSLISYHLYIFTLSLGDTSQQIIW